MGTIERRTIGHLHWHDDLQVVLVRTGDAAVDCSGEHLACRAGQAILLNSGTPHRVSAGEGCVYDSLLFPPKTLGFFPGSEMATRCVAPYVGPDAQPFCLLDGIESWHAEMMCELDLACELLREPGGEQQRYLACAHLSLAWGTYVENVRQELPSEAQRMADERLKACAAFVDEHYAEHVSLADIAAAAGIGKSECARVFRRCLQTSPYAYLTNVRLSRATDLMKEGELTLSAIAHATGFGSPSHFSNAFRKAFGISPKVYLAELRQG